MFTFFKIKRCLFFNDSYHAVAGSDEYISIPEVW